MKLIEFILLSLLTELHIMRFTELFFKERNFSDQQPF
jgi:hypothetical protein